MSARPGSAAASGWSAIAPRLDGRRRRLGAARVGIAVLPISARSREGRVVSGRRAGAGARPASVRKREGDLELVSITGPSAELTGRVSARIDQRAVTRLSVGQAALAGARPALRGCNAIGARRTPRARRRPRSWDRPAGRRGSGAAQVELDALGGVAAWERDVIGVEHRLPRRAVVVLPAGDRARRAGCHRAARRRALGEHGLAARPVTELALAQAGELARQRDEPRGSAGVRPAERDRRLRS